MPFYSDGHLCELTWHVLVRGSLNCLRINRSLRLTNNCQVSSGRTASDWDGRGIQFTIVAPIFCFYVVKPLMPILHYCQFRLHCENFGSDNFRNTLPHTVSLKIVGNKIFCRCLVFRFTSDTWTTNKMKSILCLLVAVCAVNADVYDKMETLEVSFACINILQTIVVLPDPGERYPAPHRWCAWTCTMQFRQYLN